VLFYAIASSTKIFSVIYTFWVILTIRSLMFFNALYLNVNYNLTNK